MRNKTGNEATFREKLDAGYYKTHPGEFQADALHELNLDCHPKADLLFSKAWDLGHSYGHSEVWWHLEDLADLIR